MIRFACVRCGCMLNARPEHAGGKVSCPSCSQRLEIPAPSTNKTVLAPLVVTPSRPPSPIVPVTEALAPPPEPLPPRRMPPGTRLGLLLLVVVLLPALGLVGFRLLGNRDPNKGEPIAANEKKSTDTAPRPEKKDVRPEPWPRPSDSAKRTDADPEEEVRKPSRPRPTTTPLDFDINDPLALLQWLDKATKPLRDAEGNEVATERAITALKAELEKLKGRELRWPLKVMSVSRSGVHVQSRLHPHDLFREPIPDRRRFQVRANVFLTNTEGMRNDDTLFIPVRDQDFLATIRPQRNVTVRATVQSIQMLSPNEYDYGNSNSSSTPLK
jgi:hypothetical protein